MNTAHSASTKVNASSGNLKWIKNGHKPKGWGYERSNVATWLFLAPWQISFLFDKINPFLASGLMSHNRKKKVKMCFLQSPVIGIPTLLDRSYRRWQKSSRTSWRLSLSLASSVVGQGWQNKGIGYMGLNRLLNMIEIFMTFCLTYYWFLIFVYRYKEALFKLLIVQNNLVIYTCG